MTNCRVCGRTPEKVAEAASEMRRLVDARYVGFALRTRWRHTLGNAVDEMCWFCQRFHATRDFGPVDRVAA